MKLEKFSANEWFFEPYEHIDGIWLKVTSQGIMLNGIINVDGPLIPWDEIEKAKEICLMNDDIAVCANVGVFQISGIGLIC